MKNIEWIGSSYGDLLKFPKDAKQDIGYNLDKIQRGLEPRDWKSMPSIGVGVKELRIHLSNEYRVIYLAKYGDTIYVLHSFVKKTQKTSKKDIEIAKDRLKSIKLRKK